MPMKPRKKNDETNEMSEITNPAIAEEFVGASGRQTTMGADLPYVTGADLTYVTGSEGLYVTGSDGPYVTGSEGLYVACADLTAGARTATGAGTAGFEAAGSTAAGTVPPLDEEFDPA